MRHEFSYNGRPKLRLIAENAVEELILDQMHEDAAKGATVALTHALNDNGESLPNTFLLEVGKP